MIHSKFFLFTLLCGLVVGSALAFSIETPEKKISLRFSTLFNFINFSAKDSYFKNCNLNQPIDIGIGGGIGDFFWDFTYALPFSIDDKSSPSEVFELKTNFYPRGLWLHGMVGFYNRFVFPKEEEYVETKLQIFEARISGLYFLENERFSWRAAYELDRIQKETAGSWLVGGEFRLLGLHSKDSMAPYYAKRRMIPMLAPKGGYSHTFIFSNDWFLNLTLLGEIGFGIDLLSDKFVLAPEAIPKLAFGKNAKSWSWNMIIQCDYTLLLHNTKHWDSIYDASFVVLFVRRF